MGAAGSKASRTLKNSPVKSVAGVGGSTNKFGYVIPEKSIDPQKYDPEVLKAIMDEGEFESKHTGLASMLQELDNTLKPQDERRINADVEARIAQTHTAQENMRASQATRIAAPQFRDMYEACARAPDESAIRKIADSAGVDAELLLNVLRYSSIPVIRQHPKAKNVQYATWYDIPAIERK